MQIIFLNKFQFKLKKTFNWMFNLKKNLNHMY